MAHRYLLTMTLTLLAISLNEQPLTQPITARFDAGGGTIGRADHNTMALPDPERIISRLQAEVFATGDGFLIRNVGSANPIVVGGRSLTTGETATLGDGDAIRIGGYLLRAEIPPNPKSDDAVASGQQLHARDVRVPLAAPRSTVPADVTPARPAMPPTAPRTTPPWALPPTAGPALSSSNPFADLLGDSAPLPADPFADLLGGAGSAPPRASSQVDLMPPAAGIDPRSTAVTPPPPPPPRLPDDFDPFAAPASAAPAAAADRIPVDPFADLMPAGGQASIDDLFGLGVKAPDDALARFESSLPSPPSASGGSGLPTDPLQLFGGAAPASSTPVGPPQPDQLGALHAAYRPPRPEVAAEFPAAPARASPAPLPARPAPDVTPMAGAQATSRASAPAPHVAVPLEPPAGPEASAMGPVDDEAMWAAFCEGAGVTLPLPHGSGAERMRLVGRILRSAVHGTLQLMAVRATTKQELRAAMTMIQPTSNNPLKFSPDAVSGVEQLVRPPARGFLDGPAAMDDAMHDLVGHAIGTVAGMRAALEGVLDRFDPAALEDKLAHKQPLDKLLPMSHRAKLWKLYLRHYQSIREEAQEDFHSLFGKAFLAAYEQQVERLKDEADAK